MNVALIGYGKMGQSIEKILIDRGHNVVLKIDKNSADGLTDLTSKVADVAIEFTAPESAFHNISSAISHGVPVVSGSTGWLDRVAEIEDLVHKKNGAFFYSSNYSLGVNIFFHINKVLAKLIDGKGYDSNIHEIHHVHKLDSPSGTAITLAEGILDHSESKQAWVEGKTDDMSKLQITSERKDEVPGTHIINHKSEIDTISISHEAHSRKGFAMGAVLAAEWLPGKQGIFGMDDYLNFKV